MARDVGELADALNQDADTVFKALSTERQGIAEVLFRRITESRQQAGDAEDERPVRRPQTVARLAELAQVPVSELRAVVDPFDERGLLVLRATDEGDKVDLPHECLCPKWNRLRQWIEDEAQDAKALRFLRDSVGKSHLTGSALAEAVGWQDAGRLKAAWGERYLSRESVREVGAWVTGSRRRARATQIILAVAAVAAIVGLGGMAYYQTVIAQQQEDQLIAQQQQLFDAAIVVDDQTTREDQKHLWWIRFDNSRDPDYGSDINWDEAMAYCDQLSLLDYRGWRLPTIDELVAIWNPATRSSRLPMATPVYAWSSDLEGSGSAWLFFFHDGYRLSSSVVSPYFRALCVRVPDE